MEKEAYFHCSPLSISSFSSSFFSAEIMLLLFGKWLGLSESFYSIINLKRPLLSDVGASVALTEIKWCY
jgi:hypothetical protein